MLSQTVEYALRAIVFLAKNVPIPSICEEIAEVTKVPKPYMSKVLQSLVKAKILYSQRGLGGGVSLAITPQKLSLLQVINAIDPVKRIKTCPMGLASHGIKLCVLHMRIDNAMAMIEESFHKTTVDEILNDTNSSVASCDFPPKRLELPQVQKPKSSRKIVKQSFPRMAQR